MSNSGRSSAKRGLPSRVRSRHGEHFVDTLAKRDDTPIGKSVAMSSVEPDPRQPRGEVGDLSELAKSIEQKGVLEPILVREHPEAKGRERYLIVSGERRYRASLEVGLGEIPVIVLDVNEQEALEIALIENLQRKDLTAFEEADGYQALVDLYEYSHEQIAESVGKARSSVTESLSLLKMSPRVRQAVQALGIDSKSVLLEVLKAKDEEEQIRLLESVAERGLSRDDLRRRQRRKSPSGRRKPFVFTFRDPEKTFNLSLKFRKSTVDREDLIGALEKILEDLRNAPEEPVD